MLSMYTITDMLFSDNEISKPETPANARINASRDPATNETVAKPSEMLMKITPKPGDDKDDNGEATETLNMAVEEIVVVIDNAGAPPPTEEGNDAVDNDAHIAYVINESGMGGQSRHLDVTTDWTTFPEPALYKNDDGGESYVMLGQGPWFDWRALEEGGIIDRCEGDW